MGLTLGHVVHQGEDFDKFHQGHVATKDARHILHNREQQCNQITGDFADCKCIRSITVKRCLQIFGFLNTQSLTEAHLWSQAAIFESVKDPCIHVSMEDPIREGVDILLEILVVLSKAINFPSVEETHNFLVKWDEMGIQMVCL